MKKSQEMEEDEDEDKVVVVLVSEIVDTLPSLGMTSWPAGIQKTVSFL